MQFHQRFYQSLISLHPQNIRQINMAYNIKDITLDNLIEMLDNLTATPPPDIELKRHLAFDASNIFFAFVCLILAPILLNGYTLMVFTTRALFLSVRAILMLGYSLDWYVNRTMEKIDMNVATLHTAVTVSNHGGDHILIKQRSPPGLQLARISSDFCRGMDECLRLIYIFDLFMRVDRMEIRKQSLLGFVKTLGLVIIIVSAMSACQFLMEKLFDTLVINIRSDIAQNARPFHLLLTTTISVAVIYMGIKTIIGLMKNNRFRKENGMRVHGKSQPMVAVSIVIVSTQILKISLEVFGVAWMSLGQHAHQDEAAMNPREFEIIPDDLLPTLNQSKPLNQSLFQIFNRAYNQSRDHPLSHSMKLLPPESIDLGDKPFNPVIWMYLIAVDVAIFEFVFLISCVLRARICAKH